MFVTRLVVASSSKTDIAQSERSRRAWGASRSAALAWTTGAFDSEGNRFRFTSKIPPPYLRRTKSVEELIPLAVPEGDLDGRLLRSPPFYDFPAEHWRHLRTTNPIESTFATMRLRTKRATHRRRLRLCDQSPTDALEQCLFRWISKAITSRHERSSIVTLQWGSQDLLERGLNIPKHALLGLIFKLRIAPLIEASQPCIENQRFGCPKFDADFLRFHQRLPRVRTFCSWPPLRGC